MAYHYTPVEPSSSLRFPVAHKAYGSSASASNISSCYNFGKVWNIREQGFKYHEAELPFGKSCPRSSDHSVKNYEVLVCSVDTLCLQKLVGTPALNATENQPVAQPNVQTLVIVFVVVVLVLLLLLLFATSYYFLRIKRIKALLSDSEVKEFLEGRIQRANAQATIADEPTNPKKFCKELELSKEQIIIDFKNILGSGAFGTVYKGIAKGIPSAIKIPNNGCTSGIFKSFLSEVTVLCHLGAHTNILGFVGAYITQIRHGVLYIATELCVNGSLEDFLRKKKHVAQGSNKHRANSLENETVWLYELHRFAFEIACGMEYIASKNVVHGDLSTRNVFLDAGNVCKIGDFGLSRKLDEYNLYVKESQEPMPGKWLAYECLTKMEFTCKSDVWGYGVTVWEIFSLGKTPYAGLTWTPEFTNELENGLRLPPPSFAEPKIYSKLQECWKLDPKERTTCAAMVEFYREICDNEYTSLVEFGQTEDNADAWRNRKAELNFYVNTPL